jgi:hypothetical protein
MGRAHSTGKILVGKREVKRPFGIVRCTYEDNIKMNLKGIKGVGVD